MGRFHGSDCPRVKSHVDWGGSNREYRYTLWRIWDDTLPIVQWIGLNPSTADEFKDDQTIRKCVGFARAWGAGSICMTNLFAWRDTKPENMKRAAEPVGPENDHILQEVARHASIRVAAWGNHGVHLNRAEIVAQMIPDLMALKINEATGQPGHPLYIPYETQLIRYEIRR